MFGGGNTFGASNTTGFGSTPSFGAAPNTSVFGSTGTTFGAQQPNKPPAFGGSTFGATGAQGGGMFGATNTTTGGGMFGAQQTSTFGATNTSFGQPSTSFGGFGQTNQAQPQGGGLFGSTSTMSSTVQPSTGGLFGSQQPAGSSFGSSGGAFGGFGAAGGQQAAGTGHVKFQPVQGTDTMMKSGINTNINTRNQCITAMKEYENKSLEELRFEDYSVGRKGQSGAAVGGGGLFGSTQPATGGLFGAQPASTASGGMFGQQQNKPLFGTTGGAFGATSAAPAFGSTATSTGFGAASSSGGLFGAKPTGFGTTTSTAGFGGGFGQPQQTGGLFGQQQAAKPFGAAAPQPQAGGGLFGSTNTGTTGFGAPAANTGFGGFGQTQQQPQQQIGLFGANQNQAKPAFGFGAQTASSAPSFGGFGTTTQAQAGGGLFGQQQAAKPAFGGFGTTPAQPASTGFGGFGATSSAGGGLFANQAKPAFAFGGTSTANTGFGGFGTNTAAGGAGLFAGASKPGGLFGNTGTGFGTGTGGFGTGGTTGAFGATTGTSAFGTGGLNFGQTGFGGANALGAAGQAGQPGAAPAASSAVQQQLLLALAASPFGENPLFKTVTETGKRAEVLKGEGATTSSPGQGGKGLAMSQYKVAPHRNIKVKTKPVDSVNKSSMFDGLDDDLPGEGDMFVPRSSIKKLVLRNKKNGEMSSTSMLSNTVGDDPAQETSLTVPLDESRLIVKKAAVPPPVTNDRRLDHDAEESFTSLNTRKKNTSDILNNQDGADTSLDKISEIDANDGGQDKEEGSKHPGGIILNRSGYYTIPPLNEIEVDGNGRCIVEGFTIGREGYGNVHYPGSTDITGLNLDEIVFFRHKEVIVYPEDENKAELGEGLNKKAQITLDKVWPTDKNDSSLIKSPDKIRSMSFEDKLIRASTRLGAKFIEYRPETGSWVFKVDHFSKYGLDDSDEEEPALDNSKKMKTLHLEKRGSLLDAGANLTAGGNLTAQSVSLLEPRRISLALDNQKHIELIESDGGGTEEEEKARAATDSDEGKDVDMNDISAAMKQQTTLLRSALFSENLDNEGDMSDFPAPKPVILQHRNTSINQSHSRFMEDAPGPLSSTRASLGGKSTLLGGSKFQGLGGSTLLSDSMLNTTSLLRSHYSIHSTNMEENQSMSDSRAQASNITTLKKTIRLPSYSLTAGYDKFTQLQNSVIQDEPATVTPQYVDTEVPLESSFLSKRFQQFADAGLFQNKKFRVGFGPSWKHMETPGGGYLNIVELENRSLDDWEVDSLQNWLKVALDNSNLEIDDESGPLFSPVQSVQTLQNHYLEASNQHQECDDISQREKLWEMKHTWNLIMALWDTLESQHEDDMVNEVESHGDTLARRELFSAWLEEGVQRTAQDKVRAAREKSDHLGKVLGLLDSGDVEAACDALQQAGDHRAAMLISQIGSGPNSQTSRLIQHQINRWREVQADRHIDANRLRLFSLVAGQPVQNGNGEAVNTLAGLDWQRALAHHLWYLGGPLASVPDTLSAYDGAWNAAEPYCSRPQPKYSEDTEGCLDDGQGAPLDIKYHILKLYSDRSHSLESTLTPSSHTSDPLDFRASWFIYRILESLGYSMSSPAGHIKLCKEFASQLEKLGLWHWAVYVLLHIQDPGMRQASVEGVLGRSVALEDEDSEAKQEWILDTLRVPIPWLARAKSVLARVQGNQEELAEQLLKAEDWKEAHRVIVDELAPSAILSQEPHTLLHFLKQLSADNQIIQQIPGWDTEGKIYLEFLSGAALDRVLQGNRDTDPNMLRYEFERLKPLVTNLCRSIGNLPVNTSKQRLAQSEIAKQAAHYMRAVYSFEALAQSGGPGTTARQLAESLSNLPLPEDYALQELRNLTRSYLSEIMES